MRCDSWDKKIRKKVVLHYFSDCPVVYDGSTFELFPDSEAISDGIKETFDVEVTQDLFLQQGEKGCDEFAAKALINEFSEQDERIKCLVPAGYCFAVIIVGDPGIRYKSWGEPTLIQRIGCDLMYHQDVRTNFLGEFLHRLVQKETEIFTLIFNNQGYTPGHLQRNGTIWSHRSISSHIFFIRCCDY